MTKQCVKCSRTFNIEPSDFEFYKKMDVPSPTLCPDCRQQRRLAWRNERKLYHDTCDLCKRSIISLYNETSPYIVYCQDCWWSDRWDPLRFGRPYDFSKSFFEQFQALQLMVPRLALFNLDSVNSEYTNHSVRNKNCYMGVAVGECEDCLYGHWVLKSKNCVDNLYCEQCELCYECSYCAKCYATFWSQYCQNANDCLFCFECRDVQNCLGGVQLHHKQYYILNKPVTPEQFAATKQALLTDIKTRQEFIQQWEALKLKAPRRFNLQEHCESSTGNDLYHCRNAKFCFNCRNLENAKYMFDLGDNKDSMDAYEHGWLVPSELIYEAHAGMTGYNFKFTNICAQSKNLTYCDLCQQGCSDLFGCVGLRRKQFCILNQVYREEEYHQLVKKITAQMKQAGEYGEFFPMAMSTFAYNETAAQEYFPLRSKEVAQFGGRWYESSVIDQTNSDPFALQCAQCHKLYRITTAELSFYQQTSLPTPQCCPDCRHLARMALRNPRQLWQRQCMCTQPTHDHKNQRCAREFETTYSPERRELVYCEECYQKEIY